MRQCRLSQTMQTPAAAEPLLTPPPIQRQDSARWYADHRPAPPKRQVPLGEEFAAVMDDQSAERRKMVRGSAVKLQYIFVPDGAVGAIASGTTGRVSKRIHGGWLVVKFDGQTKSVKVRTSNCLRIRKAVVDAGYDTFRRAMADVVAPESKELWAKMSADERRVWERAEQQVQAISDRGV